LYPAVREFNARLSARGVRYQFPTPASSDGVSDHKRVTHAAFVAVDDGGRVRGGYTIRRQPFRLGTEQIPVGFYQLPLSEGVIDARFGSIGLRLLGDALKRQPDLYVLGIGGLDEPLARMVRGLGWPLEPVSFHFKVVNGYRFARGIRHVRERKIARVMLDAAAFSGAAAAAATIVDFARRRRTAGRTSARLIERFDAAADEVWQSAAPSYGMLGARDAATLAELYPERDPRFLRLAVERGGRPVGWAVMLDTPMADHRYFGDLRVGSIVDCLAAPEDAGAVILQATLELMRRRVDLIVSNQQAACWQGALDRAGFLRGPSSYLLGLSKPLVRRLAPLEHTAAAIHVNRGDGDGPINL
jgi:hypothetical protein